MTSQPSDRRQRKGRLHPVEDPAAPPPSDSPAGLGSSPATTVTVGLATAARVLGISPAAAQVLAEHDEFPCAVIRTTDGYRVTFAALVRILHPRRGEPAPGAGSSSERR